MSLSSELSGFAGFLRGLPAFLRYRITPDQAREAVVRRIRERESNFLARLPGPLDLCPVRSGGNIELIQRWSLGAAIG